MALLSTEEAADYLGVPEGTMRYWRYRRIGPRYSRLGRAVKYRQADLDVFLEANAVDPETVS